MTAGIKAAYELLDVQYGTMTLLVLLSVFDALGSIRVHMVSIVVP